MLAWTTPKAKAPLRVVNSTAWLKAARPAEPTLKDTLLMASPDNLKDQLERLITEGWLRVGNAQDDPLDHLFGDAAKQWILMWHPTQGDLYLLFKEQPQWLEATVGNTKAQAGNEWRLYRNGELIHQHRETTPRRSSDTAEALCQALLDKQYLLAADYQQFLTQYVSRHPQSVTTLLAILKAQPEILGELKETLFWMLENGLQTNRLNQKNNLVKLFQRLVETNLLHTRPDRRRLDNILSQLGQQYSVLNLLHRFQSDIQQAHWMFQTILTDGMWRHHLTA